MRNLYSILVLAIFISNAAYAESTFVRWTGADDRNADLAHIVDALRAKTGYTVKATDFILVEDRDLANNHFQMFAQQAGGLPIHSMSIRVWKDLFSGAAVQVEAKIENPAQGAATLARALMSESGTNAIHEAVDSLTSEQTMALVRERVSQNADDSVVRSVKWSDTWDGGTLVRVVQAKGKRGTHTVRISVPTGMILDSTYDEFPQGDGEFSIAAQIYPIYEEVESNNHMLERVPAELKYLKSSVAHSNGDPFASLRTQHFTDDKQDPVLGMTDAGRAKGYWAMSYIKQLAADIRSKLPLVANDFKAGGVILDGRYATVSLYPEAAKLQGLNFTPAPSSQFKPDWEPTSDDSVEEMIPGAAFLGRPLMTPDEASNRPARRLPNHDPVAYMNDGFDELQVYYAINTLMDSLHARGFSDPELSTRPFNAFLYDQDISMRDNAFYTDDTINFTTYSPKAPNMARDNPTIWHELGHGIMDRLMGDSITLADTGGLSEGMADFVAALVIEAATGGVPFDGSDEFRIINHTAFNLTNEVHDDGEAYGGAMRDFLEIAMQKFGRAAGLAKVTDVTLEAMRLARNHPGLTAPDWFSHILFADQLGNGKTRGAGELHDLLLQALGSRNFTMDGRAIATYTLKNGDTEVAARGPGSRNSPIPVALKPQDVATYHLSVQLTNSDVYQFKFPVTVKAVYNGGPLEGAIHWLGEEKGPQLVTLNSPADVAKFDVTATGKCDEVNREDGSCVDFVYVQIWNAGETNKPQAKKRFYLRVKPTAN